MTEEDGAVIRTVAARHGFGEGAVAALWDALRRGGGRMAQFSHPELGGMGQWSGGGLLQIGIMFDDALKARVAAALDDLAARMSTAGRDAPGPIAVQWQGQGRTGEPAAAFARGGWPNHLGQPSASGSQAGLRYAYFAAARRLAVERDGRVTLYDTGRHQIFGVSQGGTQGQRLAFTADDGTVDLDALPVVAG